jgi:rhodanese-related sulfurtransferase
MTRPFPALTLNARLGLLLGLLGVGALVIGNPATGPRVTLDPVELSRIVQTETDHVSVEELADWIIRGKKDFRLIDLRSEADFATYHIPGAENVQLTALAGHGLLRNEKIILYSEGGIHSAQAWFLMKAREYQGVYLLRGGLEEWKETILFPRLPSAPTAEQAAVFEKKKEVSKFFGGTPLSGSPSGQSGTAIAMPQLAMPPVSAAGAATGGAPAKKKKEGC